MRRSKQELLDGQTEYSIKLQRLIEAFCRGSQLPYPELHHHRMLLRKNMNPTSEMAALLDRAINMMAALHCACEPIPGDPELTCMVKPAAFRQFVDDLARLHYDRARLRDRIDSYEAPV